MGLKALRSIGHNITHSYLSLLNDIDGEIVAQHLYNLSQYFGESTLYIDALGCRIEPLYFDAEGIRSSLIKLRNHFIHLLLIENITLEHIKKASIVISFDLDKNYCKNETELPIYDCEVVVVDFRDKVHKSKVKEWWRS